VFLATSFGAIGAASVRGGAMVAQYTISYVIFRYVFAKHILPKETQPAATAAD
jgi:hypothetical protein